MATGFIRRVVTGHDKNGKAIVISDGFAPVVNTSPLRPGYRSTDVWKTTAMPIPIAPEEPDPTLGPKQFVPPMGTKMRISELPPEPEAPRSMTPEQARELFAGAGHGPSLGFGQGKRHPMMHRTQSVDYAIVLEGEVTMVMDDVDVLLKAGDVVVQRGTNHAWTNRSGKMARILFILMDGRFEPELAELFKSGSGH